VAIHNRVSKPGCLKVMGNRQAGLPGADDEDVKFGCRRTLAPPAAITGRGWRR
jgi:hypothetical protein